MSETQSEVALERVSATNQHKNSESTKIVGRGPGGKFVRVSREKVDPRDVFAVWTDELLSVDDKDKNKRSKLQKMFDKLYDIATNEDGDAKDDANAIKAAQFITERALGRVSPAPETIEAAEKGQSPVRVVLVQAPTLNERRQAAAKELPTPKFVEAEVVSENPSE